MGFTSITESRKTSAPPRGQFITGDHTIAERLAPSSNVSQPFGVTRPEKISSTKYRKGHAEGSAWPLLAHPTTIRLTPATPASLGKTAQECCEPNLLSNCTSGWLYSSTPTTATHIVCKQHAKNRNDLCKYYCKSHYPHRARPDRAS